MVSITKPFAGASVGIKQLQTPIAARQEHSDGIPKAAQNLSLAAALAQKGPPFDADKVASLRAAIASGSYQINLGSVADGIIRFGLSNHH